MTVRAQLRRGTAGEWTAVNPVLALGELGLESDTGKFKIGNGSAIWTMLAYASGPVGPKGDTGASGPQGPAGSTGSFLLDEIGAIYRNASASIGVPGAVPFGVGPVVPSGESFYYLGVDAYNPVHIPSGSFC